MKSSIKINVLKKLRGAVFVIITGIIVMGSSIYGLNGVVAAVIEITVLILLLIFARVRGGKFANGILNLISHPVERRIIQTECEIILTFPRSIWKLIRRKASSNLSEYHYQLGPGEFIIAAILLPPTLCELGLLHLLIPASLGWLKIALLLFSAYVYLWILAIAIGQYIFPHRLCGQYLEVRQGVLYRAYIPLNSILKIELNRKQMASQTGFIKKDGISALVVRGCIDMELKLNENISVRRPFGSPVLTNCIGIAANDARSLKLAIESQMETAGVIVKKGATTTLA